MESVKEKFHTLKALADRMSEEIKLVAKDLHKSKLSPDSKDVMAENIASLNLIVGDIRQYIASSLICCEDENLDLNVMEKEFIVRALEKSKGSRVGAARQLGIAERTIYRRCSELKIDSFSFRGRA